MPTFETGSALPTRWGTFLLPIPSIVWFADSVTQALSEMLLPDNWYTDDEAERNLAVGYASEMMTRFKLTGFNPFPEGMIFPFGGTVAPDGYLLCDGTSYLADDYPELFAQIGYYFGGSGANFNVPNLINRVVVGSGGDFAIGDEGGEASVTLDVASMPSHSHSASAPTVNDFGHTHVESAAVPTAITIGAGVPAPSALPSASVTGTGFTGITVNAPTIGDTGGDGAHNNMQPFQAITYIIYAGR